MDKTWMNITNRIEEQAYCAGVQNFLALAQSSYLEAILLDVYVGDVLITITTLSPWSKSISFKEKLIKTTPTGYSMGRTMIFAHS